MKRVSENRASKRTCRVCEIMTGKKDISDADIENFNQSNVCKFYKLERKLIFELHRKMTQLNARIRKLQAELSIRECSYPSYSSALDISEATAAKKVYI